ncbi:MAG: Rpn family recombination-promoting nuclease/putative transposase [Eubacterium sp.]|nr:Rpn family recombination-promoting nuclease/putative transposase [Eubacterium sp.]
MGKEDSVLKQFFKDNNRFADLFNQTLFKGKPVIDPRKLTDMDTTQAEIIPLKAGSEKVIQKSRDVAKLYNNEIELVILGLEHQHQVHYAMPARVMLYDALTYEGQYKEIAKEHRRQRDLTPKEWLSQFSKTDKLMPVVTLVVYYGRDPWDGPKDLRDMFSATGPFKDLAGNYPMNLIEVNAIKDVEAYEDDLMALFAFVKYQKDQKSLEQLIAAHKQYFSSVSREIYATIRNVVDMHDMDGYIKNENEEGKINMCEALRQIREDGIRIGEKRGIALGEKRGIALGEKRYAQKIAKQLLKKHQPIPFIAEITDLSAEEIEDIKRTM